MENTNQKVIDKLNHLIEIAEDGKYGYETAAADIEDDNLKNNFQQFAKERTWYVTQLRQQVSALGGTPKSGGGLLGVLHRTWIDLKSAVTSRDTEAVINACITGEESAVKNYNEALKEDYIRNAGNIKSILSEQLLGIENALSFLKSEVNSLVIK